jgi:CheY-like chemotaxis protein
VKVLVVDDEPGLRNLIATYLQEEGHDVVTASDGQRAINLLESETPDLLILDMMMPGWTGQEVVRHIDRELGLTDLPLILLQPTGHQRWLPDEHTVAGVLPKPFMLDGLASSVNSILSD